jgi:putative DNA-invertase from lambdoid prophage Rac
VADLLPNQPGRPAATATEPQQAVRVEIPGKIADQLSDHPELGQAERHALLRGRIVRRGQGYSLHVTALPDVHQALLAAAATLAADEASPAGRKAYRIYADRLNNTAGFEASAHPTTAAG